MLAAGKESVVGQWKQLLDGMRQKGLSTMSVMSDDSLAVTSGGHTSASNSHSSYQYSGKKTCPSYKRIPGEILKHDGLFSLNSSTLFIFYINELFTKSHA
jgi:hypothetical protein